MGVVSLLLACVLSPSANSWGANDTPTNPSAPAISSVRTYAPRDFHEPLLDRLSGGIPQLSPYRMAADSLGRLLVTDPAQSVVHVFDLKRGTHRQITGDLFHRLIRPTYIAVDADDNIYVTDLGLLVVLVFDPSGQFRQTIGWGVLNLPTGICVDKANQTLYVADWWTGEIDMFDLAGNLLHQFGALGAGPGQLRSPSDVVVHGDMLVVLDLGNERFDLFDLQGSFRGTWPFGADRLPIAFAFDSQGNLLYVDLESGGLVAMDPHGGILGTLGQVRSYGQSHPEGISFRCVAIDAAGEILPLRPTLRIESVKLAASTPAQGH